MTVAKMRALFHKSSAGKDKEDKRNNLVKVGLFRF
jgi:hypothetical protein